MPTPVATTDWRVYLLSTLQFDVGTPVRLYGAIQAASTQAGSELAFVLGKDMPIDPRLLPPGQVTTQVDAPLGMTGVRLTEFEVAARLYSASNTPNVVDLTVTAAASFPSLQGLTLEGALVLEQTSPRLALVRLTTQQQPLTLTQLVQSVLGGTWSWADAVTDAFAFQSGDLYYLRAPDNPPAGYTYTYTGTGGSTLVCSPGYHADAVLQILGEYDFAIDLAVVPQDGGGNAVTLTGTLQNTLDFAFVSLVNPTLRVSTVSGSSYLEVACGVTVFGTALQLSAEYVFAPVSAFVGTVTTSDGSLGVEVTWTQGNFHISRIIGLPTPDLDLVDQLLSILNSSGGCEQIVKDWLKDLTKTTFSLAMNGSPARDGGSMNLPLTVRYDLLVAGESIAHDSLPFTAIFDVPDGLSQLPLSIITSFGKSAGSFAASMLSNPDTYKAIAEQAAIYGGASAMARFICRAVEEGLKDLAEALADIAATMVADTLAAAAELAAALASVALMGLGAALSGIMDLLEKVWDWITGKDDEKKQDAENQIREQAGKISTAMQGVLDAIDRARGVLAISSLQVGVDATGAYAATWRMAAYDPARLGNGPIVTYRLVLLEGMAGVQSAPWPQTPPIVQPVGTASYSVPLRSIYDFGDYQFNASVTAVASGLTILSAGTRNDLQSAIDQLNSVDNDVAHEVARQLQGQLQQLVDINNAGIASDPVYATLQAPASLMVGRSVVGVSTLLGTPP
jgi:hypothetical protein